MFSSYFPEGLRDKAVSLEVIGLNEVAWPKTIAIEILERLQGTDAAALGGDVYRLKGSRPTPDYDNWYSERHPDETLESYTRRSREEALKYIRSYPDPEDGSVLYVLVLQGVSERLI